MNHRRWLIAFLPCLWIALFPLPAWTVATSSSTTTSQPSAEFEVVDVYIDPHGVPLAAYQFEFHMDATASLVGIEGGETSAFKALPYYDPRALANDHVIVAAFSLSSDVPRSPTRICRLHIFNSTGQPIDCSANLVIAGTIDGSSIPATVSIRQGAQQ